MDMRSLTTAWAAPGCPKIDVNQFPIKIGKRNGLAVNVGIGKGRGIVARGNFHHIGVNRLNLLFVNWDGAGSKVVVANIIQLPELAKLDLSHQKLFLHNP